MSREKTAEVLLCAWFHHHNGGKLPQPFIDLVSDTEQFLGMARANSGKQRNRAASTNSDYATALRIFREFLDTTDGGIKPFQQWCVERLNAKEPHCA